MDIYTVIIFLTGGGIGFLIGLTGVGGGVLLMPILILALDMEASTAIGTASVFMILTKIYAGFEHARIKNIDYGVSKYFLIGSTIGVIVFAGGLNYIISKQIIKIENMQTILNNIIAITMFVCVGVMIAYQKNLLSKLKHKSMQINTNIPLVISGFFTGALMGVTGLGGGALIVPIFFILTSLSSKKIVGTSIAITFITSIITAIFYAKGGRVDYEIAIIMTLGSSIGVFLASKVIKTIDTKRLNNIIIILIGISGLLLVFYAK